MSIISVLSSCFGSIEPKHQNHHKLYWGIKKTIANKSENQTRGIKKKFLQQAKSKKQKATSNK